MNFSISNLLTIFSKFGKVSDEIKSDKMWYESSTIWANVFGLIFLILDVFTNLNLGIGEKETTALSTGIIILVNIFIRIFKTNSSILIRKSKEDN